MAPEVLARDAAELLKAKIMSSEKTMAGAIGGPLSGARPKRSSTHSPNHRSTSDRAQVGVQSMCSVVLSVCCGQTLRPKDQPRSSAKQSALDEAGTFVRGTEDSSEQSSWTCSLAANREQARNNHLNNHRSTNSTELPHAATQHFVPLVGRRSPDFNFWNSPKPKGPVTVTVKGSFEEVCIAHRGPPVYIAHRGLSAAACRCICFSLGVPVPLAFSVSHLLCLCLLLHLLLTCCSRSLAGLLVCAE